MPVWEAVQARSRIGVERVHGATLVGRQREVVLLEDALTRVLAERSPQLVTIMGVPGIGKSRLVLELYEAVERLPDLIAWRHGRCLPYGEGITFWALGEMVKAQEDVDRKLREVAGDPWIESHLRPLVGLAGAAEGGGDMRDEAFAAWRRFFEGLAEERPLVLVFEDLHWADEDLLDVVDHLVDPGRGRDRQAVLVGCTRRRLRLGSRGARDATARARAEGVRTPGAGELDGGRSRVLVPAPARPGRCLRADPPGPSGPSGTCWRPAGSSSSGVGRTTPRCSRTTTWKRSS